MLTTALAFVAGRPRLFLGLGLALIALIAVGLIYRAGEDRQRERQAAAAARTIAADARIKEDLADVRQADAAKAADTERSLVNANAGQPDGRPSDRRLRYRCQQLRNQGTDVSGVPECAGPAPGG